MSTFFLFIDAGLKLGKTNTLKILEDLTAKFCQDKCTENFPVGIMEKGYPGDADVHKECHKRGAFASKKDWWAMPIRKRIHHRWKPMLRQGMVYHLRGVNHVVRFFDLPFVAFESMLTLAIVALESSTINMFSGRTNHHLASRY